MALVKDNPLIPAVADVRVFAISLANADSLLKLGGANGLPFNNPAAQLIGTTIAGGVTPTTNIALLSANAFTGAQTATKGNGSAFIALSGVLGAYGSLGVGRTAQEAALVVSGAINTGFTGVGVGDILLVSQNGQPIHIGTVLAQPAAIKVVGGDTTLGGDLKLAAGKGIFIKEGGAAACMGVVVLNGVTPVLINTTKITATSRVFFSCQTAAGTLGLISIAARTAGVSFSVKSSVAGDVSTYAWEIREPAP
jgi:hypothetical protein